MTSYQSVIYINIMKFLIGHKAFVSLCTMSHCLLLSLTEISNWFTFVRCLSQPTFLVTSLNCSRPPLCSRGNFVTSHPTGPGSIPCPINFLTEVFPRFSPSTVRQMSGNLGHILPRLSYDHQAYVSSKPYIIRLQRATVSDHSCSIWPS